MALLFEGLVLQQAVASARHYKVEPAALLAVVEVESAGKSLEQDGVTPCLLFERHIFYRELRKAGKSVQLDNAVAMGLANQTWQPATQYKDEGSSHDRLDLLRRASVVDPECAIRACSWGVGQTMGFLAEEIGFAHATAMLDYMKKGGVPAQIDCMIREMQRKDLLTRLNMHDWEGFARIYNGPGYATNHYDVKMAAAYLKWSKAQLPSNLNPPKPGPSPMPKPPPVTPGNVGGWASLTAGLAAVWALLNSASFQIIGFVVLFLALTVITAAVLWHRHQQSEIPERGMRPAVTEGISP